MTSLLTGWADRALDFGLEQVSTDCCPLALLDVRCKGIDGFCWCLRSIENDHGATYLEVTSGERIVMWEPYKGRPRDVEALRRLYGSLGIEVALTDRSVWNPGETVAIEFRREVAP